MHEETRKKITIRCDKDSDIKTDTVNIEGHRVVTILTDYASIDGYTLQVTEWTPEIGELYYYVDIEPLGLYEESWSEQKEDKNRLSLNLIFPHTPEGKKQAEARLLEVAFLKK